MKLKKKTIAVLLAASMAIALLASCGNSDTGSAADTGDGAAPAQSGGEEGAGSGEAVTLKHWFWPDSDHHIEVFNSMVEDFNATNGKNITVEVEVHPWDGGQFSEDLFVAALGGGAPDTAGFKLTSTPLFVANDLLEPLDSYIDAWADKDDMDPSIMEILRNVTDDGNLYLMPWNIQVLYVYYRPSYFEMTGIDVPTTYEEFLEAIEKNDYPNRT